MIPGPANPKKTAQVKKQKTKKQAFVIIFMPRWQVVGFGMLIDIYLKIQLP